MSDRDVTTAKFKNLTKWKHYSWSHADLMLERDAPSKLQGGTRRVPDEALAASNHSWGQGQHPPHSPPGPL